MRLGPSFLSLVGKQVKSNQPATRGTGHSMKAMNWVTSLLLLAGCNSGEPPQAHMETVHLASYHPWPVSYVFKTRGDWALLTSNETIQIDSTKMNAILGRPAIPVPDALMIRNRTEWEQRIKQSQAQLHVQAKLDLVSGLVCLHATCAPLLAICPPIHEMRRGKKCRTFNVN